MATEATSVPQVTFGPNGFIAPAESDILTGVMADLNAAFGGNLNPGLSTPQGQLASSIAAIIGNANDLFLELMNGIDPAYNSGRMQDAIARIYFLQRKPAQPTAVSATCTGLSGVVIPFGSLAVDTSGNVYASTQTVTIPGGGNIVVEFAGQVDGPISCPIGALNQIYQAIPGWDSIYNFTAGVLGNDVESRENFEVRRQQSVFLNSLGSPAAVLSAVLAVPNVLDAYVLDNASNTTSGASFTGNIVTGSPFGVLTASSVTGTIAVGQIIVGAGVAQGNIIEAQLTGTPGGAGTYSVTISQAVSSEAMISAMGGIQLAPHSIYVAVVGGAAQDIGNAIWSKKAPGCGYNGNTTVTVYDQSPGYAPPYPSYNVTFQIPTSVPIFFSVTLANNIYIPSNALALIQAAIVSVFTGQGTTPPAIIGSTIFASSFYTAILALGSWVTLLSVYVGISASPTNNAVAMRIDQVPTIVPANITLTLV